MDYTGQRIIEEAFVRRCRWISTQSFRAALKLVYCLAGLTAVAILADILSIKELCLRFLVRTSGVVEIDHHESCIQPRAAAIAKKPTKLICNNLSIVDHAECL